MNASEPRSPDNPNVASNTSNPYAPPTESSYRESPAPVVTFPVDLSIKFSGRPDQREIDDYLRAHAYISLAKLLLTGFAASLLLLALATIGPPFILISIGMLGMLAITLTVSTLPYRRIVFQNLNPTWSEPVDGQLTREGITLRRKDGVTSYKWDWFCGVVLGKTTAAFIPATQTGTPLFVSRGMLHGDSESEKDHHWLEIQHHASSLGLITDQQAIDDRRGEHNVRILRDRTRERTLIAPKDAVRFQGNYTTRDLARVSGLHPEPIATKILRSRIVTQGMLLFVAVGLSGLSKVLLDQYWVLPALLLTYVIAWHFYGRRWRKRRSSSSVIYYLNAFATETYVTLDMAIHSSTIPWSSLQLVADEDEFLAFRRPQRPQAFVARLDMFSSRDEWQKFRQLAHKHVGS